MAKKQPILDKMAANPAADWKIEDVKKVAAQEGLDLRQPKRGSHYVATSEHIRDALTIPFKRPIKAMYIRLLVSFALAHRECEASKGDKL